jgi:hypothetical protein
LFWVTTPIIAIWVGVGGVLLRRGVKALVSRNQGRLGRCLLISSLAGLAGGVAGFAVLFLLGTLGNQYNFRPFVPAALAVPPVFLAVAFTVIYASFEIPAGALVRISGKAFAIPLLAVVVGGSPAAWFSYSIRQADLARKHSVGSLKFLGEVLTTTYTSHKRPPPDDLMVLVTQKIVPPDRLKCRTATGRSLDYFYVPAELPVKYGPSLKILACDFLDNQDGRGRAVLFINGDARWYSRDELPALLGRPENRDFAAALGRAESAGPGAVQGKAPRPASAPAAKAKP